jgi:uncharacterized FlgJ-related protein
MEKEKSLPEKAIFEDRVLGLSEFREKYENFFIIFSEKGKSGIVDALRNKNPELAESLENSIRGVVKIESGKESAFRILAKIKKDYEGRGEELTDKAIEKELSKHDYKDMRKTLEPYINDMCRAYLLLKEDFYNKELGIKYWEEKAEDLE